MSKTTDFKDRFWSHVKKGDDCWEWQACKTKRGYGRFQLNGKTLRSHRLSWELCNGREIPEGMIVLHSCDNPSCVNPSHLSIGTHKENVQDCIKKGRKRMRGKDNFFHKNPRKGELNTKCKLTPEKVKEIRSLKGVVNQYILAEMYGVSQSSISAIQRGENWSHI